MEHLSSEECIGIEIASARQAMGKILTPDEVNAEKIEALNIRMQRIEKRLGLLDDAEFVRVIRCRNCLHYHNNCLLSFNKTGGEKEQFCDLWNASLVPDDYCCFGKPRSE